MDPILSHDRSYTSLAVERDAASLPEVYMGTRVDDNRVRRLDEKRSEAELIGHGAAGAKEGFLVAAEGGDIGF